MAPLESDLHYTIRRSARARRVRVTVDADRRGRVVTLPERAPRSAAPPRRCVELRPWIERRRARARRAPPRRSRASRGRVPSCGETLRVVAEPGRTRVHRRGDVLLVPPGDAEQALERWYRRRARGEIGPRLDAATARAGTPLHRADHPRPAHALGVVLVHRRDVVQLAAAARAARRCSTTWSSTRSATSRSWTTRRASGRCSSRACPTGASTPRWLRRYGSTLVALRARGAARRRRLAARGSTTRRRSRPVHASNEPSPRTSMPAAHAGPAQLGAGRDLLHRLEAAHVQVHGLAPRAGPAARARRSSSASASRACRRRACRPSARARTTTR